MLRHLSRLATTSVVALVLGSTALITDAGAAVLACGQTITVSTTLENDVGPCPNGGIIIGANNITFNLNGHRIFGTANVGDGAGIYAGGRTGVTIRAGRVTDFDGGVVIEGGSGNTVQQVIARDNIGTVSVELFSDFGDGILLVNSSNNRLLQNVAEHNGPYSGITLLGNSDSNLLQGNVAQSNDLLNARPGQTPTSNVNVMEDNGIRLETISASLTPDSNRLFANTARNNGLDGISVFPFAKDNVLDSNVVSGNGALGNIRPGDGIHVFGRAQRTLIQFNRVVGNARHGIVLEFFTPGSNPPGANRVERNVSLNNAVAPQGFQAFDLADLNHLCDGNTWTGNTFNTKNDPGSDCIH